MDAFVLGDKNSIGKGVFASFRLLYNDTVKGVWSSMKKRETIEPLILLTGQHRTQLEQALAIFGVPYERNLDVMTDRQTLPELAARILPGIAQALRDLRADYVLVHGDTLTTSRRWRIWTLSVTSPTNSVPQIFSKNSSFLMMRFLLLSI